MMKEEKGNIEQMSERLFHYLRKRESSASQEAEDEVWSKISKQIDKKKHIPVYRWLIPVTAVAAASLLFVFWLNNQAYDTIHSADVQEFVSAANTPEKHIELITATGTKIKVDEKATVAYAQDGNRRKENRAPTEYRGRRRRTSHEPDYCTNGETYQITIV